MKYKHLLLLCLCRVYLCNSFRSLLCFKMKGDKNMLTYVNTPDAPAAIGPYSQGIICGSLLFTLGQIPLDPKTEEISGTTIEEQAEQVMKNMEAILISQNTVSSNVVKTTCLLADMNDFNKFNEVYAK